MLTCLLPLCLCPETMKIENYVSQCHSALVDIVIEARGPMLLWQGMKNPERIKRSAFKNEIHWSKQYHYSKD